MNNITNFNPFQGPVVEKVVHITQSQAEIWISCTIGGDNASRAYNESISLILNGALNHAALDDAIQQLVQRHEALRSVFSANGHFMSVLQFEHVETEHKDFSELSATEKKDAISDFILVDANYVFDLVKGPLVKIGLLKTDNHQHHLVITAHHIICDGWSLGTILYELGILYSATISNTTPALPPAVSFSAFADELQDYGGSQEHVQTVQFWLDQYKNDIPQLNLPIDFPRPELRTHKSERLDFPIDNELIAKFKKVGIQSGCSFVTTLMTAFEVLLYVQTGQDDVVVGLPSAGQAATGKAHLIGHCVNLLPLRSKLNPNQSFNEYLKDRKLAIFDAYDHQQLSFGELLQELHIQRDPSRVPLVPVVFNIDMGMDSNVNFTGLTFNLISNPRTYETFELFLNASGSEDNFILEWSYNTSLFTASTIKQMMLTFEDILLKIVENPEATIAEIIKIDASIYTELNDTSANYPNASLHELISKQAKLYPKKQAIKFSDSEISYEEFDQQVNQLAHSLSSLGIGSGDFVGVCLPRSIELIITLNAIMQCGAAYLPLDPNYPSQRLNYMLDDSSAKYLVCTKKIKSVLNTKANVLILDDLFLQLSNFPAIPISIKVNPKDVAYLLYTSGSTGKPKGVVITHKNLVNFLYSMKEMPGIKETDRLLSITTISFDIAGLELFTPLLSGATLVLANEETAKDGRILLEVLNNESITILQATPTTWQMLLDLGWDKPIPIKALCGGEPLSINLAKKLLTNVSELWNMYGPTETTIWSSTKQILNTDDVITIGCPIANTQIYILNEQKILMEPGKTGEIVIGGDGVSIGYWKRMDLNTQKFIDDPFSTDDNSKLYLTGDLGKLLPNGELQCLGRIDHQVKIRGHRIELQEIEEALDVLDSIQHALVIVKGDLLITYLISDNINELTINQINNWKKDLAEQLPAHMIPQEFNLINKFPTTLNGKIDRQALLNKSIKQSISDDFTGPRSKTEEIVNEIWCESLSKEKIDIYSDFFELGGHSILAIKIVARLENETGKKIPLSALMVYPTIEKLSNFLDKGNEKQMWDSLVPLRKEGNKAPLYIVPGVGHSILFFNSLSKLLDEDQPVYGLQAKGLNGIDKSFDTVEEMASHYITEIVKTNPEGPYALAGHSFGGIVVYEMARQLKAQGKTLKFIGLFDSYVYPVYYYKNPIKKKIVSLFYLVANMIFIFLNMFSNKKNFKRRIHLLKLLINKLKSDKNEKKELQQNSSLKKDTLLALNRYTIRPQDIKVDLFRAKEDVFFAHDFKFLGWKKLARKGIRKHMLPGNHLDMFDSPNVEVYARNLQQVLNEYDSDNYE